MSKRYPKELRGQVVFCVDVSMTGTLLPIAPCGRSSLLYLRQASNFSAASANVRNQCAFRHSALNRPLNASMNALPVGLPGREKSSVTPR